MCSLLYDSREAIGLFTQKLGSHIGFSSLYTLPLPVWDLFPRHAMQSPVATNHQVEHYIDRKD